MAEVSFQLIWGKSISLYLYLLQLAMVSWYLKESECNVILGFRTFPSSWFLDSFHLDQGKVHMRDDVVILFRTEGGGTQRPIQKDKKE